MKAAVYDSFGEPQNVAVRDIPTPKLGPESVLIEVQAAAVNPVDWQTLSGALQDRFTTVFPVVPGWDAAGTVVAVGPGVRAFSLGDEVMGYVRQDYVGPGAFAELLAAPERTLVLKPAEVSWEQAASLPLAGSTAYQGLFERLRIRRGESLFVQAAAGGVGSLAVQLARSAGLHVIGSGSPADFDYIASLGASPVDYHEDVSQQVRASAPQGVDAVFDMFGGDGLAAAFGMLSADHPDRVVSLADDGVRERGGQYIFARPDQATLQALAEEARSGRLSSRIGRRFSLQQASAALQLSKVGHPHGRIIVQVQEVGYPDIRV